MAETGLMKMVKMAGVRTNAAGIQLSMRVAGNFARALIEEDEAGETTPKALEYLDLAIADEQRILEAAN